MSLCCQWQTRLSLAARLDNIWSSFCNVHSTRCGESDFGSFFPLIIFTCRTDCNFSFRHFVMTCGLRTIVPSQQRLLSGPMTLSNLFHTPSSSLLFMMTTSPRNTLRSTMGPLQGIPDLAPHCHQTTPHGCRQVPETECAQ